MKRFLAVVKKEFRQIRRDPLSLGLLIFIPALLLVLYGYALSLDVKHIPMGVLDHDRTPQSRRLLDGLFQNPYFNWVRTLQRESEIDFLLNRGRVRAVLVVPRGYAAKVIRGETARVQVLVDGADATSAASTAGYFDAMADRITRELRGAAMVRAGRKLSLPQVTLEPRIWFNPEMESARFLVPGLIAMLLMLSAVIATSLSIVREKERETMEQIMVSPIRPLELILGKTLPYVLICLLTMALVLFLGYALFGIVIRGSPWVLCTTTLVFLVSALGLGILISSITRSQQVAFQVATLASMLPSIILSGLIFPIRSMPLPIQGITMLFPPRYFVTALREIIIKGAPISAVAPELASLLLLGLLFNLLAAVKIRKAL